TLRDEKPRSIIYQMYLREKFLGFTGLDHILAGDIALQRAEANETRRNEALYALKTTRSGGKKPEFADQQYE
ncbi:MAG: hypothetical protein WCC64_21305, partial [Aliidongia sp.]